jgi:membrane associated rhomboid family serine protease
MKWFSLYPVSLSVKLQLWRPVTYQFLHGGMPHIFFNMLGLFFLGPTLERYWSSKRFLIFYLSCGVAGGLFYLLLVIIGFLPALPMVGASGAILGMLAACAILFPHFVVFIFLFPVPIRVAAIAFTAIYLIVVITRGANAGGDAAHLAGMAAGAIYVFSQSWRAKLRLKIRSSRLQKKITAERNLQVELDRILQKVHDSGIHNLTPKEKKILGQATEAEQERSKL